MPPPAATAPAPPAAAPVAVVATPPRVVLLMDAPTNSLVAGYLVKRGYSVEIVRDLKYCSLPLLKSASFIVLNANGQSSPFYEKIKATLRKVVPDRLFEQAGQALVSAVKARIATDIQPVGAHPQDSALRTQAREGEDRAAAAELAADPKVQEVREPRIKRDPQYQGPKRSASPDIKEEAEENAAAGGDAAEGGGGGGGGGADMKRKMEEEAAAMLEAALKKTGGAKSDFPLTDEIRKVFEPYIEIAGKLRQTHAEREAMMAGDIPEDAKGELKKQSTALSKPQMPERLLQRAREMEEKAAAAKAAGKPFPPRKLPAGELYDQVIRLGELQDELLGKYAALRFEFAQFFANKVVKDTLFRIFRATGVDADYLYGTVYYSLALAALREEILAKHHELQSQLGAVSGDKEPAAKKSMFSGMFKKGEEAEAAGAGPTLTPEQRKLKERAALYGFTVLHIDQELTTLEPDLVDSFWGLYEQAAALVMERRVKNRTFLRWLRAFLRFGLLGEHPCLIAKDQLDFLLGCADDDRSAFAHEDGETNILYPDDALLQIWDGTIPPSYDEELELTGQGTPAYKWDKLIRKLYAARFKIQINQREVARFKAKFEKQQEAATSADKMLEGKAKNDKDFKVVQAAAREAKAEMARIQKVVEKFEEALKVEQENIAAAESQKKDVNYSPTVQELAAKETINTRKYCKLLANRKEPFLPFVLRDSFQPAMENFYTRAKVAQAVKAFEVADIFAFSVDIANSPNPRKRVVVRSAPTVMLLPCLGVMGFSVSPCSSSDPGRLVLPLMSPSQSPLPRLMVDTMSDFRYDSSKLNGGMDWMTSDTVVAAYAKVRWDYRKKGKEFREKSLIYNDLPDRKNFRFHYRTYIESMDESGKKLFQRCAEMYEAFVKYIPLPDDKPKLKKA